MNELITFALIISLCTYGGYVGGGAMARLKDTTFARLCIATTLISISAILAIKQYYTPIPVTLALGIIIFRNAANIERWADIVWGKEQDESDTNDNGTARASANFGAFLGLLLAIFIVTESLGTHLIAGLPPILAIALAAPCGALAHPAVFGIVGLIMWTITLLKYLFSSQFTGMLSNRLSRSIERLFG